MVRFLGLPFQKDSPHSAPLLFYGVIIFLIYLADGIMSYVAPILIEAHVSNTLLMGFIISSSSLVGITCDFFFPELFKHKRQFFFLTSAVGLALFFPLSLLLFSHSVVTFIAAMAIWGIYFEFLVFSNFYFVHTFVEHSHHSFAWGLITVFRSIGMMISPLIASSLLHEAPSYPLLTAMVFLVLAAWLAVFFRWSFPQRKHLSVEEPAKKNVTHQLRVWLILLKKIWPLYSFIFALFVLESSFLTIGVLLAEDMMTVSYWGKLLIVAYLLPTLFTGLIVEKVTLNFGKKKTAFWSGVLSGALLSLSVFVHQPVFFVGLILISSLFSSLAMPAILGAIQDYVTRLETSRGELVGLQNSAGSLAYILGPILAGAIATAVGNKTTLAVVGSLLLVISMINLVVVPVKILLPQQELQEEEDQT
jgi:MFS family permease